jgi:DNA (cytosine-5)-methyltransferase 1
MKLFSYYNEFDPKAAAWLRELIKQGLIEDGEIDERSIVDVEASDIKHFHRCHFFAGIGGWSYALHLAGIPSHISLWTASLPCQPFSNAGKQLGKDDDRHLLPHFLELVKQCRPDTIFGEQVESAIRHGWLDDLQTTMEAESYAVGHCVLGAHSVGSFHQRHRLYWVADSGSKGLEGRQRAERADQQFAGENGLVNSGMGDTKHDGSSGGQVVPSDVQPSEERRSEKSFVSSESARAGKTGNARVLLASESRCGIWHNPDWLYCRDDKFRPVKSGLEPLVDGVSARVVRSGDTSEPINADYSSEARLMRLKGYGNAIVPQVAAEFISAFYNT